jgi:hypothetical protein
VRVSAYGSSQMLVLYSSWKRALLSLAGVVQPARVTGAPRPPVLMQAIRQSAQQVNSAGDNLRDQIRSELQSAPASRE